MAVKLVFTLRKDAKPFRSVIQLKKDIINDDVLMPEMATALRMLRKERKPFLNLALKYERILVPERSMTVQRQLSPDIKPFLPIMWDEKSVKKYNANPFAYQSRQKEIMNDWGFDCTEETEMNVDEVQAYVKKDLGKDMGEKK